LGLLAFTLWAGGIRLNAFLFFERGIAVVAAVPTDCELGEHHQRHSTFYMLPCEAAEEEDRRNPGRYNIVYFVPLRIATTAGRTIDQRIFSDDIGIDVPSVGQRVPVLYSADGSQIVRPFSPYHDARWVGGLVLLLGIPIGYALWRARTSRAEREREARARHLDGLFQIPPTGQSAPMPASEIRESTSVRGFGRRQAQCERRPAQSHRPSDGLGAEWAESGTRTSEGGSSRSPDFAAWRVPANASLFNRLRHNYGCQLVVIVFAMYNLWGEVPGRFGVLWDWEAAAAVVTAAPTRCSVRQRIWPSSQPHGDMECDKALKRYSSPRKLYYIDYQVPLSFTPRSGPPVHAVVESTKLGLGADALEPGRRLRILYDPEDPSRVEGEFSLSRESQWAFYCVLILLASASILLNRMGSGLTVAALAWVWRRPDEDTPRPSACGRVASPPPRSAGLAERPQAVLGGVVRDLCRNRRCAAPHVAS
jgi:hypothetical protein